MARVLGLRWTPCDAIAEHKARAMAETLGHHAEWTTLIERRGVLLMRKAPAERSSLCLVLPREMGAVFGPLFARETSVPVETISGAETERLVNSGGRALVEDYWGCYFAVLHDRGRDLLHIARDPAGGGAVFFAERGPLTCFFTHASDLIAIEDDLRCDERMLSAFLVQPRLVTQRTAIEGATELLAGQRLTLSRTQTELDCLWSPARPAAFGPRDFDAAAAGLREEVFSCAGGWAARARMLGDAPIAHRLSGGLDSSIVLAALKAGGAHVICFNEYSTAAPEGDERAQARTAAKYFGCDLREVEVTPEHVDYRRLEVVEIGARPSHAELSFADATLRAAVGESGTHIVSSGQGGDQVFHRARTPFIAAEAVRDRLSWNDVKTIAFDTARLVRTPIWDVAEAMLRHGVFRRPTSPYNDVFARQTFATRDAAELARQEWETHPWARAMRRAGPARALRMAHIADLQYYHQRSGITANFITAPIVASQPVIEFCLSAPPYLMTRGGRERALARGAFGSLLPQEVVSRTHKGDTTRHHARVLERQLPFLRERLLDGELVKRGLIDGAALRAALRNDVVADGARKAAIVVAFLAEIWLSRFLGLVADARQRARAHAGEPPVVSV